MKHSRVDERKYAAIALAAAGIAALILFWPAPDKPPRIELHRESDFVKKWCAEQNGEAEYRLPDKTRADCFLSGEFAAEFDWSDKWAEAIGQSLHYAAVTGTEPWIVLLPRADVRARVFRAHADKTRQIKDEYDLPINIICLDRTGEEIRC